MAADDNSDLRLPDDDVHEQHVTSYIEPTPVPEYRHAPEESREAFRDMKFGVRIHWGVYALSGEEASWGLLTRSNEERHEYQQRYTRFNPVRFDADAWMRFFADSGCRCFAFTSKHHDGFSMFATRTRVKQRVNWIAPGGPAIEPCDLAYSIMDSPFRRDIVRELCEAARRHDLKIDLYFSHPDWYDADFRPYNYHPLMTPGAADLLPAGELDDLPAMHKRPPVVVPDPSPEESARMMRRHRDQLVELLTNYGPIDMICLDQWFGASVWPALRATLLDLRRLQPTVMLRARGIGNYGDYYTPERFIPGSQQQSNMPWMVIDPLAKLFAYDPQADHYKNSAWILRSLIDTVAKGGNFMVGFGPDAEGQFHPRAVQAMQEVGAWLRVNGEAIYATRPWKVVGEGPSAMLESPSAGSEASPTSVQDLRFTAHGDTLYVLVLAWPPGGAVTVRSLGTDSRLYTHSIGTVALLGEDTPLRWHRSGEELTITLPVAQRSSHPAAFRITPAT